MVCSRTNRLRNLSVLSSIRKRKSGRSFRSSVFTCRVGRKACRHITSVDDSDQIAELLVGLVNIMNDGKGLVELLQFNDASDEVSQEAPERSLSERVGGRVPTVRVARNKNRNRKCEEVRSITVARTK